MLWYQGIARSSRGRGTGLGSSGLNQGKRSDRTMGTPHETRQQGKATGHNKKTQVRERDKTIIQISISFSIIRWGGLAIGKRTGRLAKGAIGEAKGVDRSQREKGREILPGGPNGRRGDSCYVISHAFAERETDSKNHSIRRRGILSNQNVEDPQGAIKKEVC